VATCTTTCAPGSTCEALPGNPAVKACVPDHISLCRPCQKSADCQEAGFQPGAVCHGLAADVGSFCATPCSATTACPKGYSCGAVAEGEAGATFCVPDSQVCACDDVAKAKGLTTSCSTSNAVGSCKGVRSCGANGLSACDAPAAATEVCDGADNDCDGSIDDAIAASPTSCGVGACAATGQASCAGGKLVDSCTAGAAAAQDSDCDGIDDDCNGKTDDGYVPSDTVCGKGICAATGKTSCVAGQVQDSCVAGVAAPADVTCNNADDDCNGQTDDGYVPQETACGKGICAATGKTSCVAGQVLDDCTAGVAAPSDATCNNADDNCNGQTDEGYLPTETTCGKGICTSTGTTSCLAGKILDSCTAGPPGASDASCNNLDDDCNGQTDDGFAKIPTACGAGPCASTGQIFCSSGQIKDSCVAGTPAPNDTTCDGLDDNCNGQTDEGYVSKVSNCGVGACAATGKTSCEAGKAKDNCTSGTPAPSDLTCDGKDDNCNGLTDDGFVVTPTACGKGECAATGSSTCVGGAKVDTCKPLAAPETPEVSCDNLDNDCDGLTDGADSDVGVANCCAGNAGQMGVDPKRACPTNWFCDQSWDTLGDKSSEFERRCYFFGNGAGTSDGECSPYDCGKATGQVLPDGTAFSYDWCVIFKSLLVLNLAPNDINAACGWSTNGVFASNSPRSGSDLMGDPQEFDGGWCSCSPLCELFASPAHPCCKNVFGSGAFSGKSANGAFTCGKTHISLSTLPTFKDPHAVGAPCRHDVECLGKMKCSTPGTYLNGVPVPTVAPKPAGTCSGNYN
jgi:hypothetical protein